MAKKINFSTTGSAVIELETYTEVLNEIHSIRFMKPRLGIARKFSGSPFYLCGCGEVHQIDSISVVTIGYVNMNKFLFLCSSEYVTYVSVKGLFKTQVNSHFTAKRSLVQEIFDTNTVVQDR